MKQELRNDEDVVLQTSRVLDELFKTMSRHPEFFPSVFWCLRLLLTEVPFDEECKRVITSNVDRLAEIYSTKSLWTQYLIINEIRRWNIPELAVLLGNAIRNLRSNVTVPLRLLLHDVIPAAQERDQILPSYAMATGDNSTFTLGLAADGPVGDARKVPLEAVKKVSMSNSHTLFLTNKGDVFGCGLASNFGRDENNGSLVVNPIKLSFPGESLPFVDIAAGSHHSVFVTSKSMNSEMTSAENAEESVGIDTAMEHSESVPQALNNWDDIGDQVRSMERGLAPDAAGNPYTAPTAGAERVAKYDRWASLNPNSQVVKIVSSILTGIFPRIDQCTVTSSSTNVRNIDWTCPGEIVVNGQHVACTANAPINSPLPFAPLLSTLTFRSPYDFARLIAIMTQSHIPEHFRVARMLDSSYDTVTIKSIGFAISFYRAHCIHMTLATVADARGVTQGYLPRSKSDPYNLPNMYVDAVKFANENPWTEMSWRLVKPRRTLIVLPEGFQGVLDCFESPLMTAKLAIEPDDIQAAWFEEEEWSAIMLFSPARYVVASRWMNAWFLLVQAVAKGAELYVLPGPKDDRSWGITVDLLRDFAEETVVQRPPLKQRIHCLLPLKSEEHVCDAPFKILADKMNLATGPYFTQSAAKRFWTATRKHYSSMIRLPECQRVPEPKRRFGDRAPQQAAAHSSRDHRFNRPLNSGPPKQQRNRSFSRPPVFAERQNFERRSLRGKKLGRGGRF